MNAANEDGSLHHENGEGQTDAGILQGIVTEVFHDGKSVPPEEIVRLEGEIMADIDGILDSQIKGAVQTPGKTGIAPLGVFQHTLMNSPILLGLVTGLYRIGPFLQRITYFGADSQVDALRDHTGRVEINTSKGTYFLVEEGGKIFFHHDGEKTVVSNPIPGEILLFINSIENLGFRRESKIFQGIRAAAIRNVTITGGSTVKYLKYIDEKGYDIWSDEETNRNYICHTLTLGDEQYFIGYEGYDNNRIFLRDSTAKRLDFFDDIASCVAHLEKMSAKWHRITLAKAIQTFESEHELDFAVISDHIRGAIRGGSKDRVEYIMTIGYILDHIQTFTNYIEVLNRNSVAKDEKIPATIAKIGALYLVLFYFYNSGAEEKAQTDANFLDGLAKNLYRLHRLQENERGQLGKGSIQTVKKIGVLLRDSLSSVIGLISSGKSSVANAQESIIERRTADVVIDTFGEGFSYLGDINDHLYIAHIFNPMYRSIRTREPAFDIEKITGMLNTLSNGIDAVKTEYSLLVATGGKKSKARGPELGPQTQSQPMETQVFEHSDFPDGSEVTAQGGPQDPVQGGVDRESGSAGLQTNVVSINPNNPTRPSFTEEQKKLFSRLASLREGKKRRHG